MQKTFIMVAPIGACRMTSDHAAIPIMTDEVLQIAVDCHASGADGLHLRVRDDDGLRPDMQVQHFHSGANENACLAGTTRRGGSPRVRCENIMTAKDATPPASVASRCRRLDA